MSITLITGPRGSGKTYQSLKRAHESGKRFGVLAPTRADAAVLANEYGVDALSIRVAGKSWPKEWGVIVIDGAQKMRQRDFLNALGGLKDKGVDLIVTGCAPATKAGAWLEKFKDAPGVDLVTLSADQSKMISGEALRVVCSLPGHAAPSPEG